MSRRPKTEAGLARLSYSVETDLRDSFSLLSTSLDNLLGYELFVSEFNKAWEISKATVDRKGTIWVSGSCESFCDAECVVAKLIGSMDGHPIPARSLGSNGAVIATISDTSGYTEALAVELKAGLRPGDCLWIFSTSGGNDNLLSAARVAQKQGVPIVTFTGYPGSPLSSFGSAKLRIVVCGEEQQLARVQEVHRILYHVLCRRLKQYVAAKVTEE